MDALAGDLPADGLPFPPRVRGALAITRVTVVPLDAERVLPGHTVLIEDGRIAALSPAAALDVTGRPGVRVVDGAGKYLLPGLADMHVHLWDPDEAALYLAHGVTLVRNMWGHPLHLALEQRLARGESAGPAGRHHQPDHRRGRPRGGTAVPGLHPARGPGAGGAARPAVRGAGLPADQGPGVPAAGRAPGAGRGGGRGRPAPDGPLPYRHDLRGGRSRRA